MEPERRTPWVLSFLLLLYVAAGGAARLEAEPPIRAKEPEIKAAFLTSFTRYVTWPTNRFSGPGSPVVIGIIGADPFGEVLDRTAAGKSGGRPVAVRRIRTAAEAEDCHLVFISRQEEGMESKWLEDLASKPILTVGESGRTIQRGGVLEFVLVGGKVRFEASWSAMERSGIRLHSELLDVARKVHDLPAGGP